MEADVPGTAIAETCRRLANMTAAMYNTERMVGSRREDTIAVSLVVV